MKAIYSHSVMAEGWEIKHNAGYNSQRDWLCSAMLSVLLARKHYKEVILYSDKKTAELTREIPFTEVKPVLDSLHLYPPRLWCLCKLEAQRLQRKPYVHLDWDVFIWDKPPADSPVMVQSKEPFGEGSCWGFYYFALDELIKKGNAPKEVKSYLENVPRKDWFAYCCGIIGGTDTEFLRNYSGQTADWIKSNRDWIGNSKNYDLMTLFEQFFLSCYVWYYQKAVYHHAGLLGESCEVPGRRFTHTLAGAKRTFHITQKVENKLRAELAKQKIKEPSFL